VLGLECTIVGATRLSRGQTRAQLVQASNHAYQPKLSMETLALHASSNFNPSGPSHAHILMCQPQKPNQQYLGRAASNST
jgi:hypothetical protein